MGYGEAQVRDLEATVNAVDCDLVLVATPIDLGRVIAIERQSLRVTYELEEEGEELRRQVLTVARRAG
jgi:predicted GTPase